jgi:hypothetical protein
MIVISHDTLRQVAVEGVGNLRIALTSPFSVLSRSTSKTAKTTLIAPFLHFQYGALTKWLVICGEHHPAGAGFCP